MTDSRPTSTSIAPNKALHPSRRAGHPPGFFVAGAEQEQERKSLEGKAEEDRERVVNEAGWETVNKEPGGKEQKEQKHELIKAIEIDG